MFKSLGPTTTLVFSSLVAIHTFAQTPPPPPPPPAPNFRAMQPPPQGNRSKDKKTAQPSEEKQGLVSAKTNMSFADAQIEDITNENFPDLIESFDYPNADIADVIKAVSELTGKNFIVDPSVRGKITIIAPSRITVAEAYRAFLSALAINGMTVVPSGPFLKVKPARAAQRDSIETYTGAYFPNDDQVITKIIKLKYISAEEVNKNLRILQSKEGEIIPYAQTNSIIMSDYGTNVERFVKIINEIDVPGFEEQLEVIRIKFAKSKDIADLINQIINKGEDQGAAGVPRFRRARTQDTGSSSASSESYSLVISDDRTNSIVVVGNKAGIQKIQGLVKKLDFHLSPEDSGGVYVYYVRHAKSEEIAETLNGIADESKKATQQTQGGGGQGGSGGAGPVTNPRTGQVMADSRAIFGGEVKITADKNTNSLIIVAGKQDYETVRSLLAKIDIAKDQVFVKTVILEMSIEDKTDWGIDVYRFVPDTNGAGRFGFRSSGSVLDLLDPSNDSGAVIGFGAGETINIEIPGQPAVPVKSITGLIKFFKQKGNANILSTPQIMALNNEESTIEVGEEVPVAFNTMGGFPGLGGLGGAGGAGGLGGFGGFGGQVQFKDATIKLTITPYISPDTDSVQLDIDQQISDISQRIPAASQLREVAVGTTKRAIQTKIVVNSGDTAVLGGLMTDSDRENELKVPILGDIPLIGWLFKKKDRQKVKNNLVVFITPEIIRNQSDSAEVLNKKLNERIDYIQKFMQGRDPHGEFLDNLPRKASTGDTAPIFDEEPAIETF